MQSNDDLLRNPPGLLICNEFANDSSGVLHVLQTVLLTMSGCSGWPCSIILPQLEMLHFFISCIATILLPVVCYRPFWTRLISLSMSIVILWLPTWHNMDCRVGPWWHHDHNFVWLYGYMAIYHTITMVCELTSPGHTRHWMSHSHQWTI